MATTITTNIPDIVQTTNTQFTETTQILKDFLSTQSEFKDYNFEGSNLKQLINLLSLNTMLTQHFSAAGLFESQIYTATQRGSVVQAAQDQFGYYPHNYSSAITTVRVTLKNRLNPESITLPRGSQFTGTVPGGNTYNFILWEEQTIIKDTTNSYVANLPLVQGRIVRSNYVYDADNFQKIIISDENIDRQYMRLYVNNQLWLNWTNDSFVNSTGSSNIYYVRENYVGQTEVYFGEGVEVTTNTSNYVGGLKPKNNDVITVEYINTKGAEANGATKFSYVDTLNNVYVISVDENPYNNQNYTGALGGQDPENIERIRAIAPIFREAQNRCVVDQDYETFVYNRFGSFVQSVRCFTDSLKPGYAFIAIKPIGGISLDEFQKTEIKNYLKRYNVSPITPIIIEPNYLFIKHFINVQYRPSFLNTSEDTLRAAILESINNYYIENVETFGNSFHVSRLLAYIDNTHYSILGSSCDIELVLELYNYFQTPSTGIKFNNSVEDKQIYSSDLKFAGQNLDYNVRFAVTQAQNDTTIGQVIIGPFDPTDINPEIPPYEGDDFVKNEEGIYYSVGTYDYYADLLIFNLGILGIEQKQFLSQYAEIFSTPLDENIYTKNGTLIVYDYRLRPDFTNITMERIQ